MPKYVIQREYLLPVYQYLVIEADTFETERWTAVLGIFVLHVCATIEVAFESCRPCEWMRLREVNFHSLWKYCQRNAIAEVKKSRLPASRACPYRHFDQ